MSDLKLRIKKLLAMAESTSEHEAKTALLKARALMAEHKLTFSELEDDPGKVVKEFSGQTATKMTNFWKVDLAATIGRRYCCQAITNRHYNCNEYRIGFVGFEKDIEICKEVFDFAVGYVEGQIKIMRHDFKKKGIDGASIRRVCNGYGQGFSSGVRDAFRTQDEEKQEYGLVLVVPKEVEKAVSGYSSISTSPSMKSTSLSQYAKGYDDGKNFSPARVIKNNGETPLAKIA